MKKSGPEGPQSSKVDSHTHSKGERSLVNFNSTIAESTAGLY